MSGLGGGLVGELGGGRSVEVRGGGWLCASGFWFCAGWVLCALGA